MSKEIENLMQEIARDEQSSDSYIREVAPKKREWILNRADMYAQYCGVSREDVLTSWEQSRSYWYMNYYQDCNQPNLTKKSNVMSIAQWKEKGKELFGDNAKEWQFECPNCHNVQTMQQFFDAGIEPNYAYCNCASRFGIGGLATCNWSAGGLISLPCTYVITEQYKIVKVFNFHKK